MAIDTTLKQGVSALIALFAVVIVYGACQYGGATMEGIIGDKLSATSQWNTSVNTDLEDSANVFADVWDIIFLVIVIGSLIGVVKVFGFGSKKGNSGGL